MRISRKVGKFEITSFLEKSTNEIQNRVLFKGKKMDCRILNNPVVESYLGFFSIQSDLKQIQEWLECITTEKQGESTSSIERSLFVSSLTFYWKCFSQTKGRGRAKLSENKISKDLLPAHKFIKELRHNFAAHSGDAKFESGIVLKISDSSKKQRFTPFLLPIHKRPNSLDGMLLNNFQKLVQNALDNVELSIDKAEHRVNAL